MAVAAASVVSGQQPFRPVACTVCLDSPLKVPVFQCINGHLLCFDCERRLEDCPTCKVRLGKNPKSRNLAVEEIQSQLFYCANFPNGCDHVYLDVESKNVHEIVCEVRANPLLQNHPQFSTAVDSSSETRRLGSVATAGPSIPRGPLPNPNQPGPSGSGAASASSPEVVDLSGESEDEYALDGISDLPDDFEQDGYDEYWVQELRINRFIFAHLRNNQDSDDEDNAAATASDQSNAGDNNDEQGSEMSGIQSQDDTAASSDIELNSDLEQTTEEEDNGSQEDSDRSDSAMNEDASNASGSDAGDLMTEDDNSSAPGLDTLSVGSREDEDLEQDFSDNEDVRSESPEVDGEDDSVMVLQTDSEGDQDYPDDDDRSLSPGPGDQGDHVMADNTGSEEDQDHSDDDQASSSGSVEYLDQTHVSETDEEDNSVQDEENRSVSSDDQEDANMADTIELSSDDQGDSEDEVLQDTIDSDGASQVDEDANVQQESDDEYVQYDAGDSDASYQQSDSYDDDDD